MKKKKCHLEKSESSLLRYATIHHAKGPIDVPIVPWNFPASVSLRDHSFRFIRRNADHSYSAGERGTSCHACEYLEHGTRCSTEDYTVQRTLRVCRCVAWNSKAARARSCPPLPRAGRQEQKQRKREKEIIESMSVQRELSELTIELDGANRDAFVVPFNEINHNGAEGTTIYSLCRHQPASILKISHEFTLVCSCQTYRHRVSTRCHWFWLSCRQTREQISERILLSNSVRQVQVFRYNR